MRSKVQSPCVQVCKYDKEGICLGCYRSMEEITQWIFMSDEKKQQVLQRIEERKNEISTEKNNYDYYV
ncbi:MAG: DUF1289 domain-containing protein [Bacteroidales bacterium]|nr:DUF1289 domain-containing protein [Bacteroidales bacterium]